MYTPPNEAQLVVLRWLGSDPDCSEATNSQRASARALANRRLVSIRGHGPKWVATLTDAGRYYLEHGAYPDGHSNSIPSVSTTSSKPSDKSADVSAVTRKRRAKPQPEHAVVSPAEARRHGHRPSGDDLSSGPEDPWDDKIMITVKEAAWMLSLPEHAIREAVANGDVQRVFIGKGTTHYRIVYGSLLAWVNSMPREPRQYRWWL